MDSIDFHYDFNIKRIVIDVVRGEYVVSLEKPELVDEPE
jgi:hypothetical protein